MFLTVSLMTVLAGAMHDAPRACALPTDTISVVGKRWLHVRAALDSASRATGSLPARLFDRVLDRYGKGVRELGTRESTVSAARPFASRTPDVIARDGYLVETETEASYYAPDAMVLLSPEFTSSHCFSEAKPAKDHAGMVGLAFKPERDRQGIVDVDGTMWLDEATLALRSIEYRYTGVPQAVRAANVGGQLRFARHPSAGWLLSAWEIRMPQGAINSREMLQHSQSRRQTVVTVESILVSGGEIIAAK